MDLTSMLLSIAIPVRMAYIGKPKKVHCMRLFSS